MLPNMDLSKSIISEIPWKMNSTSNLKLLKTLSMESEITILKILIFNL
jgi:hypothetical protein